MTRFVDRRELGRLLGHALLESGDSPVVVGIAPGGTAVAAEAARVLRAPLDLIAVDVVTAPFEPGTVIAAVTKECTAVSSVTHPTDPLSARSFGDRIAQARQRAARVQRKIHDVLPSLDVTGRHVILIADGSATPEIVRVAARTLRQRHAERVTFATPAAVSTAFHVTATGVDRIISLTLPMLGPCLTESGDGELEAAGIAAITALLLDTGARSVHEDDLVARSA